MRHCVVASTLLGLSSIASAAGDYGNPDYQFTLSLERSALDGLTLGDDQQQDRLVIGEYQLEIALDYEASDDLYLFFVGTLVDDGATLQTAGLADDERGLEINQIGLGYLFGDTVAFDLNGGRLNFLSASDWWFWWDEDLDAVRLQATHADLGGMLAVAEPLAPDLTSQGEIDPEKEGLRRRLLSLSWALSAKHSLIIYYLDQNDRSGAFDVGDSMAIDRIDEEDADLAWFGISYLAEFDLGAAGEVSLELHAARVDGEETVYQFDESGGVAEVGEIERHDVAGTAQGILVNWTPGRFDEWTLILGRAAGSGDSAADDERDNSYRETGLQGDNESFGELYQPELSNLSVDIVGIAWEFSPGVELTMMTYRYEQRELADEMRDVSIGTGTTGESRDLGREADLVLRVDARDGMELRLILAEFHPGQAYGEFSDETSNFTKFEMDYRF